MEIDVTATSENPLLEREEFELQIDHTGEATPSVSSVRKSFAAENDFDPEKVEVGSITTAYGGNTSTATVRVYEEKVAEVADEEPATPEDDQAGDDSDEADEEPEADDNDGADEEGADTGDEDDEATGEDEDEEGDA